MSKKAKTAKTNRERDSANLMFEEYKQKVIIEGENMVFRKFPEKIAALEIMANDMSFDTDDDHYTLDISIPVAAEVEVTKHKEVDSTAATALKTTDTSPNSESNKAKTPQKHLVTCNSSVTKKLELLVSKLREMIADIEIVRMWILFMVPPIQSGNNFGVEILEAVLDEVMNMKEETKERLKQINSYYLLRGDMVAKVDKFPHSEDYRRSVFHFDDNTKQNCRLMFVEMRNDYSNLYEKINKNVNKIREAKSNADVMHFY